MGTRTLSSAQTFLTKFVFPAIWIPGFGLGTLGLWLGAFGDDMVPFKWVFLALHRELNEKKYRYNRPDLLEQEWGMTELCVVDPFNNRITFGERTGASAAQGAPA
jgi:hypothetical protein